MSHLPNMTRKRRTGYNLRWRLQTQPRLWSMRHWNKNLHLCQTDKGWIMRPPMGKLNKVKGIPPLLTHTACDLDMAVVAAASVPSGIADHRHTSLNKARNRPNSFRCSAAQALTQSRVSNHTFHQTSGL